MGGKLHNIGFGSGMLYMTLREQATKEKMRWISLQLKTCSSEDIIQSEKTTM